MESKAVFFFPGSLTCLGSIFDIRRTEQAWRNTDSLGVDSPKQMTISSHLGFLKNTWK